MTYAPFARLSLSLIFFPTLAAFPQRLPANAHPTHYKLALIPDIAHATFAGSETIDLTLDQPSATITLNALELNILSVQSGQAPHANIISRRSQPATISYDPTKEQATFTFPELLPAGPVSLQIQYTGILNDKLRGFYLSKTNNRNFAVTQFESTDARRAFPSFDEPAQKATFDISLTVDKADMAISNTNVLSDTPEGSKRTLVYATTPKMSTYLVVFLVGDFACSSGKSDGVPIRVCATPDKLPLTKFAVKAAENFLHYYDTYFGIKYPMPKLDLIGIPDFEAGAMENFGAITYRETALLVDENGGSFNARKQVASVVAHEMAHQWFGDMVTMQWWDNLWLNEGFATWMQDKACIQWHPEWNFNQDVALSLDGTLNYDSGKTTRTIRATAETPAQIEEMFDGIAYGKAGAVLGMVEHYIGEEPFRQGVHNYLQTHLYANATAEDFWNAQTATSHQPVDRIMSSFVTQPGVPLLTFSDSQQNGVPVGQSRFFLSSADNNLPLGGRAPAWNVPVCLKTSKASMCELLLASSEMHKTRDGSLENSLLPIPSTATPFFFANAGGKGYFRTAYTQAQLKPLIAAAETALTPVERISLIGDRWALTRAGQGSVGDFLDLTLALKSDRDAAVLDTTLGDLAAIKSRLASDDERAQLDAVIRSEYAPVYAALGPIPKNPTYDQEEVRTTLFTLLGSAKDPATLAEAQRITAKVFTGTLKHTDPDADLSDASVAIAAAEGDVALYDRILIVSQKSNDPELQSRALQTLTRFRAPALVIRTLDYAASGQVRSQDAWTLVTPELAQPQTRNIAWSWVQTNWDKLSTQLTVASAPRIVAATGSFCTSAQREQVKTFFAAHPVPAAERTLAKSLDSIDDCIHFRATEEPHLQQWLSTHTK